MTVGAGAARPRGQRDAGAASRPRGVDVRLLGGPHQCRGGVGRRARGGRATQARRGLGLANLMGAAFNCYTTTGSFSRSAVMNDVGAKTQLAGVTSGECMHACMHGHAQTLPLLPGSPAPCCCGAPPGALCCRPAGRM